MNNNNNINENLVAVAALVSILIIPLLTNFLTARQASGATKQAVAGGLALFVAIVAVALSNSFDWTNLSATIIAVVVAAKAGYEIFSRLIDPIHDAGPQLGK